MEKNMKRKIWKKENRDQYTAGKLLKFNNKKESMRYIEFSSICMANTTRYLRRQCTSVSAVTLRCFRLSSTTIISPLRSRSQLPLSLIFPLLENVVKRICDQERTQNAEHEKWAVMGNNSQRG